MLFGLCLNFGLPHLTLGQGVEVFPVASWATISLQGPHSQNCVSPSTSEICTWTLAFLLLLQELRSVVVALAGPFSVTYFVVISTV